MPEGITAAELEDIVGTAAAEFDVADSEDPEQPDDVEDEEVEETDEEDSDESEDEDVEDDDDLDSDDEGDPDDDEDDDSDEEEEDESDEEDDDEDDEDAEDDEPLVLEDDAVVTLADGTEMSGRELREGYLRQQDYTQKTQQVSEVFKKMEGWYEARANDPEGWVAEIASGGDDPASVIAGAIRRTGDATVMLGQTLRHLVESGEIADELVEALNLKQVAEQAKDQGLAQKVQTLEQQLQQQSVQAQQATEFAQVERQIKAQWANVVQKYDLDPEDESTFLSTLQFAKDHGIPNVEYAFVVMNQAEGGTAPKKATKTKKKASEAVKKRKRKTAAMSRRPTGGGKPGRKPKGSDDPVADATTAAVEELFSD